MNAPDRNAFLAARRSGLGGSDAGAVLGLNPHRSAVDVYLNKLSLVADEEMSEAAYWGIVLEDVVAKEYARRSGAKVQRINHMLRHPQKPWMIANLDRVVVTPGSVARIKDEVLLGADGLLECKTASAYKSTAWGDEETDDLPVEYAAQCMWYMAVTGRDWCDLAVLIGGQRYLYKRIERDESTIDGMVERLNEFWFKNVLSRVPPPAQSAEDAYKLHPKDDGSVIQANQRTVELLSRARELKTQIKALELELEGDKKKAVLGVAGEVKVWMGGAATIELNGIELATWKAARDSEVTNWEAVAQEVNAPLEIIVKHTAPKPGSRRFLLKGK